MMTMACPADVEGGNANCTDGHQTRVLNIADEVWKPIPG